MCSCRRVAEPLTIKDVQNFKVRRPGQVGLDGAGLDFEAFGSLADSTQETQDLSLMDYARSAWGSIFVSHDANASATGRSARIKAFTMLLHAVLLTTIRNEQRLRQVLS